VPSNVKFYKKSVLQITQRNVSNIRLKDLILQSNKKKVIDRVLRYMIDEECFELLGLLVHFDENKLDPVYKDKKYLDGFYDEIVLLCKKPYHHKLLDKFQIKIQRGDPWGFDNFISMYYININMEATEDKFFCSEGRETLPIEFLLNCRLNKNMLMNFDTTEIAALTLLQIYIYKKPTKRREKLSA